MSASYIFNINTLKVSLSEDDINNMYLDHGYIVVSSSVDAKKVIYKNRGLMISFNLGESYHHNKYPLYRLFQKNVLMDVAISATMNKGLVASSNGFFLFDSGLMVNNAGHICYNARNIQYWDLYYEMDAGIFHSLKEQLKTFKSLYPCS